MCRESQCARHTFQLLELVRLTVCLVMRILRARLCPISRYGLSGHPPKTRCCHFYDVGIFKETYLKSSWHSCLIGLKLGDIF